MNDNDIVKTMQAKPDLFARKPATESEIKNAESDLGLHFACDYKEYLKAFGAASYFGHELTGICKSTRLNVVDATRSKREYCAGIPQSWYVIEDTGMDDILIWQDSNGDVYMTERSSASQKIATSLFEYIDK